MQTNTGKIQEMPIKAKPNLISISSFPQVSSLFFGRCGKTCFSVHKCSASFFSSHCNKGTFFCWLFSLPLSNPSVKPEFKCFGQIG